MRNLILACSFILSALATFEGLMFKDLLSAKPQVLAEHIEIALTPSPSSVPTPSLTPSPSLTPTLTPLNSPTVFLTPTPTLVPQPEYTSEQINGFIDRFSGQYGVDPHVVRRIAVCESGFNPKAVNGPYAGLYQFNTNSWANSRGQMGENPDPSLRFNAEEAVQTAAYLLSLGKGYLWPSCTP